MSSVLQQRALEHSNSKVVKTTSTASDDPYIRNLLEKISEGKHVMSVSKGETIFSQGDSADAVYFVQAGRVKVSVVSAAGKEGVLAILGPHDVLGAGALIGQSFHANTAMALEPSTVFRVEKRAMLRALYYQPDLSERFMALLLKRNIGLEEDLCDQLFNDSEKRLARALLKLAQPGESEGGRVARITNLSHETLSEMVGTTRSRVTHFMNKFRKMGMVEYKQRLPGHVVLKTERLVAVVSQD